MRFAVIIPAYNCESYIEEAIRSVLDQTYENIQVVVVDDGSTDSTLAAAQAIEDARLRVLSQHNRGVMVARKAGFDCCDAEAVVFLDGDDRLRPDTISRYQRCFAAQPQAGLVYGDRILMGRDGRTFGSRYGALLNPRPSGRVLRQMLARNFISTLGQACIRTSCLQRSKALHLKIRRAVDWVLYCELAASHEFFHIGGDAVAEYRILHDSMARRLAVAGNHATDIDDVLPAIREIYAMRGVIDQFDTKELSRLRRTTEGSAFAWKGQELLRARQWKAARACFREAIRYSHRSDLRDVLCFALTYLRFFPPGTRSHIGLP